jgi:hypothetical protein
MVSIKRHLNAQQSRDELNEALLRFTVLVLESIRLHAITGDGADHEKFQADILRLEETFATPPSPNEVLIAAGAVSKTLDDYAHSSSRFLNQRKHELQTIVAALAETLGTVAHASERTIGRLEEIKKQLEKADVIEDIRRLKARLTECLETVHEESVRQQTEAARAADQLQETAGICEAFGAGEGSPPAAAGGVAGPAAESSEGNHAMPASAPRPVVAGLNDSGGEARERETVEKVLATVLTQSEESWVGLFKIERANLLMSRFGPPVFEEVVTFVQQRLSAGLNSFRQYRWDQSAILALLQSHQDIKLIRRKINELFAERLVMNFDLGRREVMLPIGCQWTVLPCLPHHSAHVLIQQIEAFLSERHVAARRI